MRVVLPLAILGAVAWSKDYSARRFDVHVAIGREGELQITETIEFEFRGGPFTYVWRELDARRTDGVTDLRTTPEAEVHGLRVTWRFEPISDTARMFHLSYRVRGAVRKTAQGDLVEWAAIPPKRRYTIAGGRIELTAPAAPVTAAIKGARASRGQDGWTLPKVQRDRAVVLRALFPAGSLIQAPPRWQARAEDVRRRVTDVTPAGVTVGLVIVMAGMVFLLRLRGGRHAAPEGVRVSQPPSDLPPALAGRLVRRDAAGGLWHAQAALLDLAGRGEVRIEAARRRGFEVRREGGDALRPHEQAAIERRPREFHRAVTEEMIAAGLFDIERLARRRRALGVALAATLLGAAGLIAALVWGQQVVREEDWRHLKLAAGLIGAGAGVFLLGIAGLVVPATISPLSYQGALAAASWKGFARYLKDVARGREPADGGVFEPYLPYAVAFGEGPAWWRRFGSEAPRWFHADQAAFASFIAVSSGRGSGGFSGAGASGGGGSGAG